MEDRKICKVFCGNEFGTGFLIDENKIVTASHILTSFLINANQEIKAVFNADSEESVEYIVTPVSEEWEHCPIAILTAQEKIADMKQTFGIEELSESNTVTACGYLSDKNSPLKFTFEVNKLIDHVTSKTENSNVVLIPAASERVKNFQGLSGSPVVLNELVTGILLRQELEDQEAIRLYAITGLQFRKCLNNQGVEVRVAKLPEIKTKSTVGNLQLGSTALTEIDKLLSKQFEPIRSERFNGNLIESWKQLHQFLEELPTSMCSHKQKAEFYYSGALWALSDGKKPEAEKYLRLAQAENIEIDIRAYRAYEYIQNGNTEAAKELLSPVETTATLNILMLCYLKDGSTISQVQDVISSCKKLVDSETNHLLALIALNHDDFFTAHQYIEQALLQTHCASSILACDALISYWEAMGSIYPTFERLGFICSEKIHFSPTTFQRERLEHAYMQLEQANQQLAVLPQNKLSIQIVWGLILVSTLLPGRDPIRWIDALMPVKDMLPSLILYMSGWGIKIPKDVQSAFLSSPIPNENAEIHLFAVLQLYINAQRYDEALQLFDKYGSLIADALNIDQNVCKLQLLLVCNLLNEAQKQLTVMRLPDDLKERFVLSITVKKGDKRVKSVAAKSVALAQKTNLSLDFENANLICQKNSKWKLAEKNAKAWFRATGELYALECVAFALERQQRYPKALRIIQRAESQGDCSEFIRQIKLNCLAGLSRFDEAIELTKTLDNYRGNENIVLFQANSYLASGQKDRAVSVLQMYIDEGQFSFKVYQMFVALIQPDAPDRAFQYARQLYLHDPGNKDFLRFAGLTGIMTGHTELSEQFTPIFQADLKKGNYVRTATATEVKKLLEEDQKSNKNIEKLYQNVLIPLHLTCDSFTHGNLGGTCFEIWHNCSIWLARYGGRKILNDAGSVHGLILDYTACLTLVALDVFPDALSLVPEVWIPRKLLNIWLSDINDLKTIQPHIVKKNADLNKALCKISYTCEPLPKTVEKVAACPFDATDLFTANCAKKHGAYIICDAPSGVITQKDIPDEWRKWNINPDELYAALDELGMQHPPYNRENTNPDKIQKLKEPCRIIPDIQVLRALLDADALYQVAEFFKIILPEHTILTISHTADEDLLHREAAEWLEKGYQTVTNLCKKGQVKICPVFQQSLPERDRYTGLLEDEIHFAALRGYAVLCDDRFTTSYTQISGKRGYHGDVLSTIDFLSLLYKRKVIDRNNFYQKIDVLLRQNYSYFIPPAEYVLSRLSLCTIDEQGCLVENTALKSLRRSIAIALNSQQGLLVQPLRHTPYTEFSGYIVNLSNTFSESLYMVWTAQKKELWKCAVSDWLLMTMGDTLCDITKADMYLQDWQPTKQASLIVSGIRFTDKKNILKPYLQWVFSYLYASWVNNFTLKRKTVDCMCELIKTIDTGKEVPEELDATSWENVKFNFFVLFLTSLPVDFLKLVLNNPNMEKYSKFITVPQTSNFQRDINVIQPFVPDETLLSGNEDYMEQTILSVAVAPKENGSKVLELFSDENMASADKSLRYRLARFLFDLSWYLPVETQYKAQEKKRYLVLLKD